MSKHDSDCECTGPGGDCCCSLRARLALAEKVCEAAESVTWFEYVEDDDDVKDAVEGLRVALAAWREGK